MTNLPATFHQTPDYHWSPANQRRFLEELAVSGNITESATLVAMSKQAAHAFRNRAAGAVFRLGWDAAVLLARARVEGDLLERAIEGQEEIYERDPETGRVRRVRSDNRLSMSVLHRLDKMVASKNNVPAETYLARVVSQDFEAFLDLIERDGGKAEAMLFLKVRDDGLVPMVNVTREELSNNSQLAQNSAVSEEVPEEEADPEAVAAQMHVWYCEYADAMRTNFPPPDDFCGEEEGRFGEDGYARSLTDEEEAIQEAANDAAFQPLREAGEAARDAWFAINATVLAGMERQAKKLEAGLSPDTIQAIDGAKLEREVVKEHPSLEVASEDVLIVPEETMPEEATDSRPDEAEPDPEPEPDPTIRTIICKPQPNYVAMGKPPPWAERVY